MWDLGSHIYRDAASVTLWSEVTQRLSPQQPPLILHPTLRIHARQTAPRLNSFQLARMHWTLQPEYFHTENIWSLNIIWNEKLKWLQNAKTNPIRQGEKNEWHNIEICKHLIFSVQFVAYHWNFKSIKHWKSEPTREGKNEQRNIEIRKHSTFSVHLFFSVVYHWNFKASNELGDAPQWILSVGCGMSGGCWGLRRSVTSLHKVTEAASYI